MLMRKNGRMRHFGLLLVLISCLSWPAAAQDLPPAPQTDPQSSQQPSSPQAFTQPPPGGKHIAKIYTNRRTVDEMAVYAPISAGTKLQIAVRDSFDYSAFIRSG